jgi:hypothetical protein
MHGVNNRHADQIKIRESGKLRPVGAMFFMEGFLLSSIRAKKAVLICKKLVPPARVLHR